MFDTLYCIVFAPIPPTDRPTAGAYGTLDDRAAVTKKLNAKLKEVCIPYGIAVLDVFDLYADEQGSLPKNLGDGKCHIHVKYNAPVREALVDVIMENFPDFTFAQVDITPHALLASADA